MLVITPQQLTKLEEATAQRRAVTGAERLIAAGAPYDAATLRQAWGECAQVANALGWQDERLIDRLVRLRLAPSGRPPDLVTAAVHAALTGGAEPEAALAALERQLL